MNIAPSKKAQLIAAIRRTRDLLADTNNPPAFLMSVYRASGEPEDYDHAEGCGTPCCIAGHAAACLGTRGAHGAAVDREVRGMLGVSASYLFHFHRWPDHFKTRVPSYNHWEDVDCANLAFDEWAAENPHEARALAVEVIDDWLETYDTPEPEDIDGCGAATEPPGQEVGA